MRILVVCDQGNNRSVTIAHHLKYWGHDVLTAGTETNSTRTLDELSEWADRIIYTEARQASRLRTPAVGNKLQLWDVGPDRYPRPFNRDLLGKVRFLLKQHKEEYEPSR
jgi:predicted protein tyrosine phosphatase